MKLRLICAALGMAMGLTPAAQAAVYQYGLTYVDTFYDDVVLVSKTAPDGEDVFEYDQLAASADPWGLPLLYRGLKPGNTYNFRLETSDDEVISCRIGRYSCIEPTDPYYAFLTLEPLSFGGETMSVNFRGTGPAQIGTTVDIWDVDDWGGTAVETADWYATYFNQTTRFVVSDLAPAPVPVPFSAALLPIGIGAFAVLRRRKARAGARRA